MKATVLEVCVGKPKEIDINGNKELSGIFKYPVEGKLPLSFVNLEGDEQANLKYHGGRTKAVYVYSNTHYPFWCDVMEKSELESSQFGQNITVDGLADDDVYIGDIFQLGTATVEVAQPRIPCAKLGVRVGDKEFSTKFLLAGRLGYYLYVIEEGELGSGDEMKLLDRGEHNITVADLWQTTFTPDKDFEVAQQALEFSHVDEGWKKRLRALLSKNSS